MDCIVASFSKKLYLPYKVGKRILILARVLNDDDYKDSKYYHEKRLNEFLEKVKLYPIVKKEKKQYFEFADKYEKNKL